VRVSLLAAGSVLAAALSACGDVGKPPIAATVGDTADQIIYGLNHQLTLDGALRTRLRADTAFAFQQTQTSLLRNIRVTFYTAEGQESSTLTAKEGKYDWRSGDMEARTDVVAVTPDGRRLTTNVLRYRRTDHSIEGPEAFVFDAPDRHLEGDGFTSDPDFRNVVTRRPRKGTLGKVDAGR
jgi:LPS export ABC transporter protein LptC